MRTRRELVFGAALAGGAGLLSEAGLITSNPQKILAPGAGRRFLNELKKELKA